MTRPIAFAIALTLGILAGVWAFETRASFGATSFQYDYVAFYCAGSVAANGADPYRVEPLRTCEHRVGHAFRADSGLVVPAPLPGYALALLAPLARLPFGLSSALWLSALLFAYVVTVRTLARLTNVALPLVLAATLLPVAGLSILLGQLVPLALAALVLAAEAIENERPVAASAWAMLAMLEPHFALPAIVALFVFRSQTRLPLAAGLVVLGIVSLAFIGFERNVEYLTGVIPAQVATEIGRDDQLAPLSLLYRLGLGVSLVAHLGTATFLVASIAGVIAGGLVSARLRAPAALVFVPPALALIGAPYLHPHHLAAALPAALLLAGRGQNRATAGGAVVLLGIPWLAPYDQTPFLPLDACVAGMLAYGVLRLPPLRAVAIGAFVFAVLGSAQAYLAPAIAPPASAYAGIDPNALAQAAWQILVAGALARHSVVPLLLALPAWVGLALVATSALRLGGPALRKYNSPESESRVVRAHA